MFAEKTVEMTRATTAQAGQLFRRMVDDLRVGHLGDELIEAVERGRAARRRGVVARHFLVEN